MNTLSIDIGGTHIKTGIVNTEKVDVKRRFSTPSTYKDFKALLEQIITDYLQVVSFTQVAFSVPGLVNESGAISFGGAVAYLNNVNLISVVQEKFEMKVSVENDAKAAVLGEMRHGNLRNVESGIALILGTGVGVGVCIGGKVYKGTHHQAGEVSFLIQDRLISDQNSFVGMGYSAVRLVKRLSEVLETENDGKVVFEALITQQSEQAQEIFLDYCKGIAILCFNMQCLLDVKKIVIGGGISQQDCLVDTVNDCYKALFKISPVIEQTITQIPIQQAKFQSDANLIGAAEGLKNEE